MQENGPLVSKGFIIALIFSVTAILVIYITLINRENEQVNRAALSTHLKYSPTPMHIIIQSNTSSKAAISVPSK